MDWVHCNICFFRPTEKPKRDFILTSCGHIFCGICGRTGITEQCEMCKAQRPNTVPLTAQMDREVAMYFESPSQMAQNLKTILDFQESHRLRLTTMLLNTMDKYRSAKAYIKNLEEEKKALNDKLESYKMKSQNATTLTPSSPMSQFPLFSKNSQVTKVIQRGGLSQPRPTSSPLFLTPSRPMYASQQYRGAQIQTPTTPASESPGSSVSPASVRSSFSYRSQGSIGKRSGSQPSYKGNFTPPTNSLSMLSVHASKRNHNSYY